VAQNHADIDAAEMEALSPGMTRVPFTTSYQQSTPAVRRLANYAGGLLGRRQAEIIDELGREAIQGKYTRFAHLVLEARGLWQRILEDERVDCQMQVAQEVRNVIWRNSDWARGSLLPRCTSTTLRSERDGSPSPGQQPPSTRPRPCLSSRATPSRGDGAVTVAIEATERRRAFGYRAGQRSRARCPGRPSRPDRPYRLVTARGL
jgi:hypothetical protein